MKRSGSKLIAKAGSVKNISKVGYRFAVDLSLESVDNMLGTSDVVCTWERGPKVLCTRTSKINKAKRSVDFGGATLKQEVTLFKKKKTDSEYEAKVYRLAVRQNHETGKVVGKIDLNFSDYAQLPTFSKRIGAPLSSGGRLILRVSTKYLGESDGKKSKKKDRKASSSDDNDDASSMYSDSNAGVDKYSVAAAEELEERNRDEQDLDDLMVQPPVEKQPSRREQERENTRDRDRAERDNRDRAERDNRINREPSKDAARRAAEREREDRAEKEKRDRANAASDRERERERDRDREREKSRLMERERVREREAEKARMAASAGGGGRDARDRHQGADTGRDARGGGPPIDKQSSRREREREVEKSRLADDGDGGRGGGGGGGGRDTREARDARDRYGGTHNKGYGNGGMESSGVSQEEYDRLRSENRTLARANDKLNDQLAGRGGGGRYGGGEDEIRTLTDENRSLKRDVEDLEERINREPVYADVVRDLRESKMALAILTMERDELQQSVKNGKSASSGIASRNML